MKLIKGLGLLSFLTVLSGSCFEPPEFPVTPQIEYVGIEFINSVDPADFDSLNLYINFKDGNGDLGFSQSPLDFSDPYHSVNYYQENNGDLQPLATEAGWYLGDEEFELLLVPDASKGKLVVFRTRKKPEYSYLPGAEKCGGSNTLKHYEYLAGPIDPNSGGADGRRLLIRASDRAIVDSKAALVDSFPRSNPEFYQIRDTLYYTPNPDHYNIEVDFFIKDPSAPGGFREFDWREEYCTTFDGRFPTFSDSKSSIDGELRYSMTSFGFTTIFGINTLKLRVSIKDHARNRSNVIETEEFTLH